MCRPVNVAVIAGLRAHTWVRPYGINGNTCGFVALVRSGLLQPEARLRKDTTGNTEPVSAVTAVGALTNSGKRRADIFYPPGKLETGMVIPSSRTVRGCKH